MLKPETIVELFNNKLAGRGKIKKCPSFFLPMAIVQEFIIISSYPQFDKIETWEEYFDLVSKSTFLTTQFTPSLAWLFKAENAFKVFSGQYDDKDIELKPKDAKSVNGDAQAMASEMFNRVIQAGNSDLMRVIGEFTEIEKIAMDKFGRASEILHCNEFQSTDIKLRLKNAFIYATSEQRGHNLKITLR